MVDLENRYSQWVLKRTIPLDKNIHRKFVLRRALVDGDMSLIKRCFRNPNEILDGYFNKTCLHYACDSKFRSESIKFLLAQGADPNLLTTATTLNGQFVASISPLYLILRKNFSSSLCKLLLKHGADINLKMGTETALMRHLYKWANRREPELRFLIEHGADIDIVDENNGYTARQYLKGFGFQDYVDYYDNNVLQIKEPMDN